MKGVANLGILVAFALSFVVFVLVISVGGLVLSNVLNTINTTAGGGAWSPAWNATQAGLQGILTFGNQAPLIALIGVMAFIIMMVVSAFSFRTGGGAA
jgi:hypothetical protein